jgi:opine dehydrogenase
VTAVGDIAVLGGGHGALATAADLALRGFRVRLALRNRQRFSELFESGRLTLSGLTGEREAQLAQVTDDHAAAVRGVELALMPMPANAQETLAEHLRGALEPGQVLALMPGNLGSVPLSRLLPGVLFAELAVLPYGARQSGPAAVRLAFRASHLPAAANPVAESERVFSLLGEVYPEMEPVEDALSAALLNSNGSLHAPLVLLNAGPIDRLSEYDIHVEGTTPAVLRVIEALDGERIGLRQALGYRAPHWPLLDYYRDADWFYGPGAFSRVQRRSVWREKIDFGHRYLAEDVGFGLALWASLGRALGAPLPLTEAFLRLTAALTGVDHYGGGRTLESLGMDLAALRRSL